MNVGIVGAGSWGTALAVLLSSSGHQVRLWSYAQDDADEIRLTRYNSAYLPHIRIPDSVRITTDLAEAVDGCAVLVNATPTQFIRSTFLPLDGRLPEGLVIVNVSKGIEKASLGRISEVFASLFPDLAEDRYAVLSGPSHAEEVSRHLATSVVAASRSQETALLTQDLFMTPWFRVYTSPDVVGVELGGAVKNVIAIGAGICDGAEFGDNTKAALITRGIAEIQRLGVTLGASAHTFAGLSGLGDLIVTTMSRHSRNRYVGEEIGKGRKLRHIVGQMKMVAEGVETAASTHLLAQRHGVEMPIAEQMYHILFEDKDPAEATAQLMTRQAKDEIW